MEIVRCAFCQELARLGKQYPSYGAAYNDAIDALFDQADRARVLRHGYGRRHGR